MISFSRSICVIGLLLAGCSTPYTLRGTFVCVECGRTEDQDWDDDRQLSSDLVSSGSDYAQRFGVETGKAHAHDWHLESGFSIKPGEICCTMEMVEGWFRALPKLKDRVAVDAVYREAQVLPFEARCKLMSWVDRDVWSEHEVNNTDLDAAFRAWLASRHD